MNPLVAQQMKEITSAIDDLRIAMEHAESQNEFLGKSREELQRKFWSQSKELRVLQEQIDGVADLKRDSEQLHALKVAFQARLREILKCTRALGAEFGP
jgi:hypothetical protein